MRRFGQDRGFGRIGREPEGRVHLVVLLVLFLVGHEVAAGGSVDDLQHFRLVQAEALADQQRFGGGGETRRGHEVVERFQRVTRAERTGLE